MQAHLSYSFYETRKNVKFKLSPLINDVQAL